MDGFSKECRTRAAYRCIYEGIALLTYFEVQHAAFKPWQQRLPDDCGCHAFAFGYVSFALGLDPVVSKRRPLSLVIPKAEPKHMGFKVSRRSNGEEGVFTNASIRSDSVTVFFGGDVNNRHDNERQLCDIKQVISMDSEIEYEIDIMWVQTADPVMKRYA